MFESYFKLIDNPIAKQMKNLTNKYERHSRFFEEFLTEKNKLINKFQSEIRSLKIKNKTLTKEKEELNMKYLSLKVKYNKLYEKNSTPVPRKIRDYVFVRDFYECMACGTKKNLTLDHIIPRVKGGTNDPSNLQTLCQECNLAKGMDEIDYRNKKIEPLIKRKKSDLVEFSFTKYDGLNIEV